MSGAALVWCPFPDIESARAAADALLDDALIACANIMGAVESRFVWDGARATGSEVGVLFKTTAARLEDVIERLGELHPYDTPAILGWQVDEIHPATFGWLMGSVSD
ncbi:divalent-cation tolerance protein CutA [Erythrobacter sp. NE805]|uniref:divalent-cation tolerance protein CutA n=1 Tax=Erythrobacter sp. NE805 TaxID=3389875 RepID=UPI00396AFC4F